MKDQFDPNVKRTDEDMLENAFSTGKQEKNEYQTLDRQDGINMYETLNQQFSKVSKQSYKTLLQNEKVELPFARQLTGWNNLIEGLYKDSKNWDSSIIKVD